MVAGPDNSGGESSLFKCLTGGVGVAALSSALIASAQTAPRALDPALAFGARTSVEDISLSPDGTKIAYVAPRSGQGAAVYIATIGGESKAVTGVNGDPERLLGCDWVANDRLACLIYAMVRSYEISPASRTVAFDIDGGNIKVLKQSDSMDARYANLYGGALLDLLPGEDGSVLMDRWFVPEQAYKTRIADEKEGYGVVRVDTRTMATKVVEQPERFGAEFITDGLGKVRIMGVQLPKGTSGYAGQKIKYSYRTTSSRKWNALGDYDVLSEEGVNPIAIDPKLNVLYALKKLNGRQALYRISLDGSLREELVFAHPQVDVDGVARVGRSRRPVGAIFTTEKRQVEYFDQELKTLAASLAKSLPNLPLVRFADASVDESKLLIYAGSDTDPGRYFLFDKTSRQLAEIMLARPELEKAKLSPMQAISYKAADGTDVPAYLTLPPGGAKSGLPAIVMPHGGPSARDEWGFDWLVQYFAHRGYAVLQPNYRGSSGYGDAWYEKNGFQSWRSAIGDVNDAGRWLVAQGVADPKKLAIVGWSYGGYAALQSAVVEPSLYKAVIAIAPVTDLKLLKEERRNWSDFSMTNKFVGSGPHVGEGSPAQNAERISAPVLLFHGDMDRNVTISQSRVMADKLRGAGKKVELVTYPKRDHGLSDSEVRIDMLSKSDAFLRSAMGIESQPAAVVSAPQ